MKIAEVLNESKHDEWDEEDEIVGDPDQDKIPHLMTQLAKAIDVDGNYPITFKNGDKVKLPMSDLVAFTRTYMSLKPAEKEKMQALAADSKDAFYATYKKFAKP
jgi:cell division septal protein FtsQ